MPFQMKDESIGRVLFYINDAGQLGLGGYPNSGQQLTVNGVAVITSSSQFSAGMLKAGVQLNQNGSVYVPASSAVAVLFSTIVQPQLTANLTAAAISATGMSLQNLTTAAVVANYSIW